MYNDSLKCNDNTYVHNEPDFIISTYKNLEHHAK